MELSPFQLGIAGYIYGINLNPYDRRVELIEYMAWRDGWKHAEKNSAKKFYTLK